MPTTPHANSSDVIPFNRLVEVEPLQVWHAVATTGGGCVTSIARLWPEGTGWCGRCPKAKCNVDRDVCLVVVRRLVPEAAAGFGLETLDGDVGGPGLPPAHRNL